MRFSDPPGSWLLCFCAVCFISNCMMDWIWKNVWEILNCSITSTCSNYSTSSAPLLLLVVFLSRGRYCYNTSIYRVANGFWGPFALIVLSTAHCTKQLYNINSCVAALLLAAYRTVNSLQAAKLPDEISVQLCSSLCSCSNCEFRRLFPLCVAPSPKQWGVYDIRVLHLRVLST